MIPRLAQLEDKLEKRDKIILKVKKENVALKVRSVFVCYCFCFLRFQFKKKLNSLVVNGLMEPFLYGSLLWRKKSQYSIHSFCPRMLNVYCICMITIECFERGEKA